MPDDTESSMRRWKRENALQNLLTVDEEEAKAWGTLGQPGLIRPEYGEIQTGELLQPDNPYNAPNGLRRLGYDLSAIQGGPDLGIVNRYRGQTQFDPQYGWLAPEQAAIEMTNAQARRNAGEFDFGKAAVMALGTMGMGYALGPGLMGFAELGTAVPAGTFGASGLTSNALANSAIKNALTGAVKSGISGGNPLKGAVGGAITGAAGGFLKGAFDASPLDLSNAGTGAALTSVNPLADLQGGNMDFLDFFGEGNPLEQMTFPDTGGFDLSSNPLFSGFMEGAGPLAFNPLAEGAGLFGDAAAGLSGLGGLSNISQYMRGLLGTGATGGGAGGSGGGGQSWWSNPLGNASLSDALTLGARLAPGLSALALAQNQGSVDTSPISNLLNNGAGTFNSPLDTSRLSSLYGQVGDLTGRNTASALQNFDTRTGQARGDLLSSLQRRNVMGSSFGNMDIGNFDTQSQNQRGMLEGQLGLQGLQAQTGIANNILGAEQAGRQQQLGYLGQQGTVASQLLNAQLQQKAIQSALYGRAFDVLGRAVAPSTNIFGR